MTQRYLEVALPVPLRSAFTYAVPGSFNGEELVGRRVLVPFRNRPTVGVGLALTEKAPEAKRIKEVAGLRENGVHVDDSLFISNYLDIYVRDALKRIK